jgi:hypothetical protein
MADAQGLPHQLSDAGRFNQYSLNPHYDPADADLYNPKNVILSNTPAKPFRLGTWTVIGLIINRTIGRRAWYGKSHG